MAKTPEQMTEQLGELNKGSIEAALTFAQVSMESAEKLMRLQLEAAKAFVADQSETAKELSNAKDADAMMALRSRLAEQAVERALGYSRNGYEVATQTQQELAKVIEERFTGYQREMAASLEKMFQSAPAGSDAAVAAVKSTIAATQSAMDSMTKAAKQAAELADANVKAVADAATNAFKSTKKK